jgi:hypothetical protein
VNATTAVCQVAGKVRRERACGGGGTGGGGCGGGGGVSCAFL